MIRLIACAVIVLFVGACLLYLSQFWPYQLWTRQSWLGQIGLRPAGDMLRIWLNGTPLMEFSLLVWLCISFAALTLTEKLCRLVLPLHD